MAVEIVYWVLVVFAGVLVVLPIRVRDGSREVIHVSSYDLALIEYWYEHEHQLTDVARRAGLLDRKASMIDYLTLNRIAGEVVKEVWKTLVPSIRDKAVRDVLERMLNEIDSRNAGRLPTILFEDNYGAVIEQIYADDFIRSYLPADATQEEVQ